jgi:murein L,D-transpeptidase YafK
MKQLVLAVLMILVVGGVKAQQSFIDNQKMFPKVGYAYSNKEEQLKKEFEKKGFIYPAKFIFLRSFKLDSELEVWIKNKASDTFRLFKSYRVCTLSGRMGPKRKEGDQQVPEGFYYINDFNPNSNYHLSLGINYPNFSDKILSDPKKPGNEIYIHGSCLTIGCIPLTDEYIEELYVLAVNAKNAGQDFIPVHVFPVKFSNPRSVGYLETVKATNVVDSARYQAFWGDLRSAYDYFEKHHQLPVVMVDSKGKYIM